MQVIDLTQNLETGMPVYPGSEQALVFKTADQSSAGYNETRLHISAHSGTHIDCGLHLFDDGFNTGDTSAERFYGKGLVIGCQQYASNEPITEEYLKPYENKIKRAEFIIFHTGWSQYWGSQGYFEGFPVPDDKAARYLCKFPLKGIGIDAISLDRVTSADLPVHKIILSHGIILVENLTNLERLPVEGFMFCCFPLKIKGGDGSPVRAVALVNS